MIDNVIDDLQFENLLRSFEQFSDECERMMADQASSETLIASAEYELEQLKLVFADARLEPSRTLPAAKAMKLAAAPAGDPEQPAAGVISGAELRKPLAA
jgi:hypothetical protein